jgi:hypothetical protein
MPQFMEVRNKKIVALIDTTGGEPEPQFGGDMVKLTLTQYELLHAVGGNLKALAVYAKSIEALILEDE